MTTTGYEISRGGEDVLELHSGDRSRIFVNILKTIAFYTLKG